MHSGSNERQETKGEPPHANPKMTDPEEIKHELSTQISLAIGEYAKTCIGIKALECYDPQKAARILMAHSQGKTQSHMVRHMDMERETIIRVLTTYADHFGTWRELGGKLAAYSYMNLNSLEEDMIESVRDQMENDKIKPTFKDLKEISIAKANSDRAATLARGDATSRTAEAKDYSDADYERLRDAAKEKFKEMKKVIDV